MSTVPALPSAFAGVQSALHSINNSSAKITSARSPESNGDIPEPRVNLLGDEQQVKASAKVIEAADSILGSILDIKV
jgi:flagellar hook protein FlgE